VSTAVERAGFRDSFRELHPQQLPHSVQPSFYTWTPLEEVERRRVFGRIDFIHYQSLPGDAINALQSFHVDASNSGLAAWPSDHRAVVADFSLH
jgi:exonuclease III